MFRSLSQDAPASLVVFLVALPLCLGIALASGAPPLSGLIAGIIGGLIVGMISGSQLGVSGPAAGLAVIVFNGIQEMPSFEIFLLAVFIGGAIQMILGFIKAGIIGFYFPSSVIQGMLAAIGIIIFLKQIPHAVGYDYEPEGSFEFAQDATHNTFSDLLLMMNYTEPLAMLIAFVGLFALILWERPFMKNMNWTRYLPGSLVAVVSGVVIHTLTQNSELGLSGDHLVQIPLMTNGLSDMLTTPDFSGWMRGDVWLLGATIAIVASLETLLCVEATDKMDPEHRITPTNRELVAQGAGNMISGLIGGLPITQVIVRSSANIISGGRTKLSAILHGLLLLVSVLVIPNLLNLIPLSSLAAILLVVGYKLAKPAQFVSIAKNGIRNFIPFIVTVAAIVFTDLLVGIGIGIAIALALVIFDHVKMKQRLRLMPQLNTTVDSEKKHQTVHLDKVVPFLHKAAVLRKLEQLPLDYSVTVDASHSEHLDSDVCEIIEAFVSKEDRQTKERQFRR
jgi:MFS superfamily sulfate permease-like transporter